MEKLKFGVVGHGFVGSRHVNWINECDDAQCVAVCDIDPDRFEELDDTICCYMDYASMLSHPDIDAVVVASPNKFHREHVIMAAKAKKHVLCEKPTAMSMPDFEEMVDVAKRNNVTFTVHQQRRFDSDFLSVKEAYGKGALGDVYSIKSSLFGYNGFMHDWHVYKSEGGGMLLDWGVHLIDQILYMVDSPLMSVFADMRNIINDEVDDYFKIQMRFENGVSAEIELGTYMLSDKADWFPRHWHMFGDKGSMYVDGFEPEGKIVRTSRLLQDVRNPNGKYVGPTRSFGIPDDGLILTEDIPKVTTPSNPYYRNYIGALQGKEPFLVTIPEMRRLLQVLDAVKESSASCRSVSFKEKE